MPVESDKVDDLIEHFEEESGEFRILYYGLDMCICNGGKALFQPQPCLAYLLWTWPYSPSVKLAKVLAYLRFGHSWVLPF